MATNSNVEILAGRFRAANVMGRSEALRKLLDFLVARSGDSNAPKELEVAAAIFGAGANFDTSQDASVRVYIHRLRQKLDEYYAGAGQNESERLTIPKGVGYRIIAEPLVPLAKPVQAAPPARSGASLRHWVIAAVLLLLPVTGAAGWLLFWQASHRSDEFAAIRTTPLWNGLLSDSRSITLVVGDYYIFGENTDNAGAKRGGARPHPCHPGLGIDAGHDQADQYCLYRISQRAGAVAGSGVRGLALFRRQHL